MLLALLVELVLELSEALVTHLLRREVVLELLMELLHLGGQGAGALLAAAAFAAFSLQFGGGSCQGSDGGAEAAFELKELVLKGGLIRARSGRRDGLLRGLGPGAFEVLGGLGQALLQFVEAGFGIGSGLLLGAEPLVEFVADLAGLSELRFQLGAPGSLLFQGGGGLLGRGAGGVKLLVPLLEMSPGALEVRGFLTQALLKFLEAGSGIGWGGLCGGSPRRKLILVHRHPRVHGRRPRGDRRSGGWRLRLGSRFGRSSLEDVGDAVKVERSRYPRLALPWGCDRLEEVDRADFGLRDGRDIDIVKDNCPPASSLSLDRNGDGKRGAVFSPGQGEEPGRGRALRVVAALVRHKLLTNLIGPGPEQDLQRLADELGRFPLEQSGTNGLCDNDNAGLINRHGHPAPFKLGRGVIG